MRWHVYGTDSVTGQEMELALEESEPTRAVKAAIDRQMVVRQVSHEKGPGARVLLRPMAWGIFLVMAGASAWLYFQNSIIRGNLQQTLSEQTHLAESVAAAEGEAAKLRGHHAPPPGPDGTPGEDPALVRATQLEKANRDLTRQIDLVKSQLHTSSTHLELDAETVANLQKQLAGAEVQLKESETLEGRLKTELALRGQRIDDLERAAAIPDPAIAKAADLEKKNQAMGAEVEKLKGELLVAAARSTAPVERTDADMMVKAADTQTANSAGADAGKWALPVPFDAASDFLALHSDADSVRAAPLPNGWMESSGVETANAVKLRIMHDRAKEKVFAAELTVSLAADAPRAKLAENFKLIADYVRAFAPGVKDADTIAAAASSQLAAQDTERRLVFVGEGCKVTAWNNRMGVFTFRAEAVGDDPRNR